MEHYKAIIFSLFCFLFFSCDWKSNNVEENFYSYSRKGDLYRIPIIKPYEINSADNGFTWIMDFKGNNPPSLLGTGAIDSIGVKESYFVLFNKRADLRTGMTKAWFLVDALAKDEKVFTTEEEYKNYLETKKLGHIKMYKITDVFKEFDTNKKLPQEWPR